MLVSYCKPVSVERDTGNGFVLTLLYTKGVGGFLYDATA